MISSLVGCLNGSEECLFDDGDKQNDCLPSAAPINQDVTDAGSNGPTCGQVFGVIGTTFDDNWLTTPSGAKWMELELCICGKIAASRLQAPGPNQSGWTCPDITISDILYQCTENNLSTSYLEYQCPDMKQFIQRSCDKEITACQQDK